MNMLLSLLLTLTVAPATHSPDDPQRQQALRHYRAGSDALRAESWDEAEQEFKTAAALDPLFEGAHYGLGQVYMATKRYPEAVRAYTRCREAYHDGVSAALTDRLASERRLDDYIDSLRQSLRGLQSGRIKTVDTTTSIQRMQDQIRDLERRRKRSQGGTQPTPPWISLALGSAQFRAGDFGAAEKEYRATLEVDPELGEAHNDLAVVLMLTGRLEDAEQEVKRAEGSGFKVNPGLRKEIQARKAAGP